MDETTTTTQAGEMPETEQATTPTTPNAAEMVTISAEELGKIRAGLKAANAEAAKHRKAAEQAEAERKQREEAEMTALDRANKRAAELEAELNAERKARLQIAAAKAAGLPDALAARLQGETAEEMRADAEAILAALPKPQPATTTGGGKLPPTAPRGNKPQNTQPKSNFRL